MNSVVYKVLKVQKFIKFGIAFCFMNFLAFNSFAQYDTNLVHKGILAGVGTVGLGIMPAHNISNAYVTGNLEYYTERTISIRGDGYFFVNSLVKGSPLKQNSSVYFGAFYHFPTHSGFDPLIGFQPGAAFARTSDSLRGKADAGVITPLMSFIIGFNFFAEKWFHIQMNIRYTIGQESSEEAHYNLNELSINFGLGWNIDVLKKRGTIDRF
jgi:hypothetical protein